MTTEAIVAVVRLCVCLESFFTHKWRRGKKPPQRTVQVCVMCVSEIRRERELEQNYRKKPPSLTSVYKTFALSLSDLILSFSLVPDFSQRFRFPALPLRELLSPTLQFLSLSPCSRSRSLAPAGERRETRPRRPTFYSDDDDEAGGCFTRETTTIT